MEIIITTEYIVRKEVKVTVDESVDITDFSSIDYEEDLSEEVGYWESNEIVTDIEKA